MDSGLSAAADLHASLSRGSGAIGLTLSVNNRTRGGGIVNDGCTVRTEIQAFQFGKEFVIAEREIGYCLGKFSVGDQSHLVRRPKSRGDRVQALLHLLGLFVCEIVVD